MEDIKLNFDPEDLSPSELWWVQEYAGETMDGIRGLIGLVFVLRRRDEPDLEVSAVENTKLRDLLAYLGNTDSDQS